MKGLKEKVKLAPFTTFKIGGPAKYFIIVKNENQLIEALKWAKKNKIKYFILGHGANILVSDQGFDGLVIKNEIKELKILSKTTITVGSGLTLGELLGFCLDHKLKGLEFLAGIPSTVGGAIVGNTGNPKKAIGDFISQVKVIDENLDIKILSHQELKFAYRKSIFKEKDYIILSALFNLIKDTKENIQKKIKENIDNKKQSQPLNRPSAGCAFKNPPGMSAGKIIEECGLKGKSMGAAKVSEIHANYIINTNSAKAEEVVMLISYIKQQVRDKKNIQLQEEIQLVGF
ncbi:MAG: UDP-N-acetylmuramate dehydrogenase [Patescibacteria group bacterium]|nr:UDP-N-acetylmuramate dehydrogenase [Patescibacteria group bacterium]